MKRKISLILNFLPVLLLFISTMQVEGQALDNPCDKITVSYDGYDYTANLFGSVCWFTQNMRNTQYADGTPIPDVRAYGDDEGKVPEYGRLYTWPAATRLAAGTLNGDSVQGLCPDGWYIPRAEDFVNLANLLGGSDYMKSSDPSYWLGAETGLSPADGYNAAPGGFYNAATGRYENVLGQGWFWSSTSVTVQPQACLLQYGCPQALIQEENSGNGFSVRCVKYYFPPKLKLNLALSNPTTSTIEADVSLQTSGSQLPVVKYYVYTDALCTGTPVYESGYVDPVVSASDTTYPTTLTGLTDGTTYYVRAVAYNHFGESESNIATTATQTLSPKLKVSTPYDRTMFCMGGTSVDVPFTATMQNADISDYTLSWSVNGVLDGETGSVLTKTFTVTGEVKAVCTAERSGYATLKDSVTVTITDEEAPAFGICVDNLTVTLKSVTGVSSLDWGDGTVESGLSADDHHTYGLAGTYTIVASSSGGCTSVKEVVLAKHTSCKLSEMATTTLLSNEAGSTTQVDSVRDHEGNWYKVVQIGSRCWLRQNMRATTSPSTGSYFVNPKHYSGDTVLYNRTSKVAHWYMNDSITYAPKGYGLLYNWCAAVDTFRSGYPEVADTINTGRYLNCRLPEVQRRGICPEGWHVANYIDWFALETNELSDMGTSTVATTGRRGNGAVYLTSGCDWLDLTPKDTSKTPNSYENPDRNRSDFCALPAGKAGTSMGLGGIYACFWVDAQGTIDNAYCRNIHTGVGSVWFGTEPKLDGRSVRCVRDY